MKRGLGGKKKRGLEGGEKRGLEVKVPPSSESPLLLPSSPNLNFLFDSSLLLLLLLSTLAF